MSASDRSDRGADSVGISNYSPLQAMIERQAAVWQRNQQAYLAAWEATVKGWLRRNEETIAAAAETAQQAAQCSDLSALVSVQQQWLAGALARLTADMTALAENAMTLSQRSISAVVDLTDEARAATPEPLQNGAWAIAPNTAKTRANGGGTTQAAKGASRKGAQPAGTTRHGVGPAGT